ncbi:hypothetical protein BDZ97DRAFT_2007568 [Flammula alnicola]|nr:hypothetical protein BDZ97DRAFT_2007568 [Flammula alnicola]
MPLDGHSYLVAQGWGGKGTGLREGAISRPLAIAQKKNLAGLGKDRDEAFPFWDHAAAKSIQVKCLSDDEEGTEASSSNDVTIKRTSTGIFSTRRPVEGTPATSGTSTPADDDSGSQTPRLSLMASAKRDAARRGLYSRFFRGPVIGPETIAAEEKRLATLVSEAFAKQNPPLESVTVTEHIEIQTADERVVVDLEVSKSSHKKRKAKDAEEGAGEKEDEDEDARRDRKRQKREEKRKKKEEEKAKKNKEKKKSRTKSKDDDEVETATDPKPSNDEPGPSKRTKKIAENVEEEAKSERKRRKEEKKRLKALRTLESAVVEEEEIFVEKGQHGHRPEISKEKEKKSSHKESKTKHESEEAVSVSEHADEGKKKKKKRKRIEHSEDSD